MGTAIATIGPMRFGAVAFSPAVLLLAGCASQELVRADEMSATQHRLEAQRETAAVPKEGDAGPAAPAAEPGGYDWNAERRGDAERRREHARQHEAAAEFLEHFEDQACRHVPASSRAACPLLGPVTRLDDVPGGLRATFTSKTRAAAALAEMRCHQAYARARHFDEAIACALYVGDIEIRQAIDPRAIEIVSPHEKTVRLIRERGRQQAVFAGHTNR